MTLSIYHKGRLLTAEQVAVFSDLMTSGALEGLSIKRVNKLFDKELEDRGMGVPDLKKGDPVSWAVKDIEDRGHVVEVDERTGKVRVHSKAKGREVTVAMAYIKFIAPREKEVASG